MLDHVFLTVADTQRAIAFYSHVLPLLGIDRRLDYDGRQGPPGHPDLKGFGAGGRVFFWLRHGVPAPQAVHVGFAAASTAQVDAAFAAALDAGATVMHLPGAQLHYDRRYYAAQVRDLDGYSLEFVHKPWQHGG